MRNITTFLNVLIVEDDLEIQSNLFEALNLIFNKVYIANNGLKALEIHDKKDIDIIISDYVMPQMDAYEFINILRQKQDDTPVIILSSFMDIEKLQKCIPLNLIHFLEKPVAFDRLIEQIDVAIKKMKTISYKLSEGLIYDKKSEILICDNNKIELTSYESRVLELLVKNKNHILSFDIIIDNIQQITDDRAVDKTTIKNIVYRLRKKMCKELILVHRNLGYSLNI
ncbi:response regulator transcription factor [Arcobacter sp. YIC-310]|uniref:response regulator transcription factor n=1 Tax=Arcobacter sp. YIC-310 TaxID=3376632 RepID=UPI003C285664